MCTASGPGITEATIGKESFFNITLKTKKGSPCESKEYYKPKIILQGPKGEPEVVQAIQTKEGSFTASYLPKEEGKHTLSVTTIGNRILKSWRIVYEVIYFWKPIFSHSPFLH